MAAFVVLDVPLCPLATFAHLPCPGCGLTRATLALARGDLHAAIALHPLSPIVTPTFAGLTVAHSLSYLRQGRWLSLGSRGERALLGLAVAMLAVWIARFFGAFGGPAPI